MRWDLNDLNLQRVCRTLLQTEIPWGILEGHHR